MERESEFSNAMRQENITEQEPNAGSKLCGVDERERRLRCDFRNADGELRKSAEEHERLRNERKKKLDHFIHRCYKGKVDMFYTSYIKVIGVADDKFFSVLAIRIIDKDEDNSHRVRRKVECGYEPIMHVVDGTAWKPIEEKEFDDLLHGFFVDEVSEHVVKLDL